MFLDPQNPLSKVLFGFNYWLQETPRLLIPLRALIAAAALTKMTGQISMPHREMWADLYPNL